MSTVELTVMILLKFYGTTLKAVSREKVYAYTIKEACTREPSFFEVWQKAQASAFRCIKLMTAVYFPISLSFLM